MGPACLIQARACRVADTVSRLLRTKLSPAAVVRSAIEREARRLPEAQRAVLVEVLTGRVVAHV